MKQAIFLLITVMLITGCANELNDSDIVNETTEVDTAVNDTIKEETTNGTIEEILETPVVEETFETYKKCRYSAISYGGCNWLNKERNSFELTIGSGSSKTIPGLWFIIYGMNETKYLHKTEGLLTKSSRSYVIIYDELVEEIGAVTRFEVLSIEEVDGKEMACLNQMTAFVPVNNCKDSADSNHYY